jgi:hypothetical protein
MFATAETCYNCTADYPVELEGANVQPNQPQSPDLKYGDPYRNTSYYAWDSTHDASERCGCYPELQLPPTATYVWKVESIAQQYPCNFHNNLDIMSKPV